jgi:hypothetical protein
MLQAFETMRQMCLGALRVGAVSAVANIRSKILGISVTETAAFDALLCIIQATEAIEATAQASKVLIPANLALAVRHLEQQKKGNRH